LSVELDLKFLIFGVKMVKTDLSFWGAELVTSVHGMKLSIYMKWLGLEWVWISEQENDSLEKLSCDILVNFL
jgi:hypothetical protein